MDKVNELSQQVDLLTKQLEALQNAVKQYSDTLSSGQITAMRDALQVLTACDQLVLSAIEDTRNLISKALQSFDKELARIGEQGINTNGIQLPDLVAFTSIEELVGASEKIRRLWDQLEEAITVHEHRSREVRDLLALMSRHIKRLTVLGVDTTQVRKSYTAFVEAAELPQMWDDILAEARQKARELGEYADKLVAERRQAGLSLAQRAINAIEMLQADDDLALSLSNWGELDWNSLPEKELSTSLQRFEQSLREAEEEIALFNDPQRALQELRIFLQANDTINTIPVDGVSLRRFGRLLLATSHMEAGYSQLTWEAGAKMLRAIETQRADVHAFFEHYGYSTIATGLTASIEDGTFPRSLTFLVFEFYPYADLKNLVQQSQFKQSLRPAFDNAKWHTLSPVDLRTLSKQLQSAIITLLEQATLLDIPDNIQLSLSTVLLMSVQADAPEHSRVARIFLNALLTGGSPVSTYYAWRILVRLHPELWQETFVSNLLIQLIEQCITLEPPEIEFLTNICGDVQLITEAEQNFSILFLLGSLGIYIYCNHQRGQGQGIGWKLVNWLQVVQPNVARVVERLLNCPNMFDNNIIEASTIELLSKFRNTLQIFDRMMRHRHYDGILSKEVYEHSVKHIFQPLREQMTQQSAVPDYIIRQISALNAAVIYRDTAVLFDISMTAKQRRRSEEEKKKVISDLKQISDALNQVAKLRLEIAARNIDLSDIHINLNDELGTSNLIVDNTVRWAAKHLLQLQV